MPDHFKFFALGGLGEVGKNCYIFEYKNQIFVVDAGVLFPDEQLLGVDYVIPDFTYLIQNQSRIVGLFITHAHEDHIGSIPFLLKQIKISNIYASGIAIDLIKQKLNDHRLKANIIAFSNNSRFKFHDIELSFIRMAHSIPDSYAFLFKTPYGNVFHSGDFKIDLTPLGPEIEFNKISKIGNEGCLVLLSDSTNSEVDGFTISEQVVSESIKEIFTNIKGRAIIATFASNIYRIQQIVEASILSKRKIAVFGRSMIKTLEAGINIGYIQADKDSFIDGNRINKYKDNELTILCTGSQGEAMAALSRIADGSHKQITLKENDTIIFSSSPIPGNSGHVNNTINKIYKKGAKVIVNSPLTDTHASGHAAKGDQTLLLTLLKPKYFIPIHGEYRMLKIHGDTAIKMGVDKNNVFILENGDVFGINKEGAKNLGKVPTSNIYIDGSDLSGLENSIIKERKLLSEEGLVSVVLTIDVKNKKIVSIPSLISRGFIYVKGNEELTNKIVNLTFELSNKEIANSKELNILSLKNTLSDSLSKFIYNETERKPVIMPIIMEINK